MKADLEFVIPWVTLILGLRPHFVNLIGFIELIGTILSEPLENPRLAIFVKLNCEKQGSPV